MNFKELQDDLADLLNTTPGTTDVDFSTAGLKSAINRAQDREIREARDRGLRVWFRATAEFTWPAGQTTLELPEQLWARPLEYFRDVTTGEPGEIMSIGHFGGDSEVFWKDWKTLQWAVDGPGDTRTIRATLIGTPPKLVNDGDLPAMIPAEHHSILTWSAGVELRERADEAAPRLWQERLDEERNSYWKTVTRGRPEIGGQAKVRNISQEDGLVVIY